MSFIITLIAVHLNLKTPSVFLVSSKLKKHKIRNLLGAMLAPVPQDTQFGRSLNASLKLCAKCRQNYCTVLAGSGGVRWEFWWELRLPVGSTCQSHMYFETSKLTSAQNLHIYTCILTYRQTHICYNVIVFVVFFPHIGVQASCCPHHDSKLKTKDKGHIHALETEA